MENLNSEIKRLSNLKQNKNKDRVYLETLAKKNIWKRQVDISQRFKKEEDKLNAERIFESYLENYEINTYNDIQNLSDLVFEETLKLRIQKDIDEILSKDGSNFVPEKTIGALHGVEERIWALKERLGILSVSKKKDDLTALDELKEKMAVYIPFHRNEFTLYAPYICSECGKEDVQPLLLRRKVNNFDVLKHPFFAGRFYYNRRGIALVKAGIWTKEQYAFVFFTSLQFVDWCIENEFKIVEVDGVEQDRIIEFIKDNPYLKEEKIPNEILEEKNNDTK